jgi:hypothetical protein
LILNVKAVGVASHVPLNTPLVGLILNQLGFAGLPVCTISVKTRVSPVSKLAGFKTVPLKVAVTGLVPNKSPLFLVTLSTLDKVNPSESSGLIFGSQFSLQLVNSVALDTKVIVLKTIADTNLKFFLIYKYSYILGNILRIDGVKETFGCINFKKFSNYQDKFSQLDQLQELLKKKHLLRKQGFSKD